MNQDLEYEKAFSERKSEMKVRIERDMEVETLFPNGHMKTILCKHVWAVLC